MNVSIIESDSGRVIVSYEIDLADTHHTPSDDDYFSSAWLSAVEHGLVDEDDFSAYSFSLTPVSVYQKPVL